MLTVHLSCPRCSGTVRCHRLIAPRERLRCPYCGGHFQSGIDEPLQTGTASRAPASRHDRGILLAWLLFVNFLLLAGGGIALAVAFGNRSSSEEGRVRSEQGRVRSEERRVRSEEGGVRSVENHSPTPSSSLLTPHSSLSTPQPLSPPKYPAEPPEPPPLPQLQRRPAEQPTPANAKPPDTGKHHPPAARRPEETPGYELPSRIQKQVDRSTDKGVEFLRRRQNADGSWGHQIGANGKRFTSGITALAGLTLLECGVSANDAQVRSAARYLRRHMPELNTTYSISLAILFFDRLSDEADVARIRTLALRLLAGQKPSGGWDYYCPTLREDEELGLLALLYKDRPTNLLDLFIAEPGKALPQEIDSKREAELYRPRPSKAPPLELFVTDDRSALSATRQPPTQAENRGERKTEIQGRKAESRERLPGDDRRLTQRALEAAGKLSEALRRTPALRSAELLRDSPDFSEPRTDNSNTQFAILGLLTAENYDVPMERAMALVDWRFRSSMTLQGGWNYRPNLNPPTTPAMTAAALMGLALKHGLLLPNRKGRGRDVVVHDDEHIHRGFLTLAGMLENYYASFAFNAMPLDNLDLYCLWTIERVAVLYNQATLGNLEWYPAGVQLLLPLQRPDGSWSPKATYCLEEAPVSSAFALLFLKRSNLARGLTERLKVPKRE